jgi:hypothetical protein
MASPNIVQADPKINIPGTFFGKIGGSYGNGDFDTSSQDIDVFQGRFTGALGYRLTDRWNFQLDWNELNTRNKFNSNSAITFNSTIVGGKAFYRDPEHFELGAGYTRGETEAGSSFDGEFSAYHLFGSIFLTPFLTSYGSIGNINGKKDFGRGDGNFIEGGLKYYLDPGLGYEGYDVSLGLNAGRIFVDDRSSDAKSLSAYLDYKPHSDMPLTFGTSFDYTKYSDIDAFSVTARFNIHFGIGTWSDTKLVDLDRNTTTMTQPNILIGYYSTEYIVW